MQQAKHYCTVLELLRKEDMDNMEIQDADVSFVNSIVPILQSLPAKKNRLRKKEIQQVLKAHS